MASMAGLSSCMEDGSGSDAEVIYVAASNGIEYTDSADTVYDARIKKAIAKLGYCDYQMKKVAHSDVSVIQYAIAICDSMARHEYNQNLKKPMTLSSIEDKMFSEYSRYFTDTLNIKSASEIGLKPLRLRTALVNWGYGYVLQADTLLIK